MSLPDILFLTTPRCAVVAALVHRVDFAWDEARHPKDAHGRWAQAPTPPGTDSSTVFPDSLDGLKTIRSLPGSTGPKLVADAAGNRFVLKRGNSPEHVREEDHADRLYRALGVPVPDSKLHETPQGPVKLSRYLDGITPIGDALDQATPERQGEILADARRGFAADALLGNWDVAGLDFDNMGVHHGRVVRIDNGGSLRYRAQGAPKTAAQWNGTVGEVDSLRHGFGSAEAQAIHGGLSDADVGRQARDLVAKRDTILQTAPKELRPVLSARLDHLAERFPPAELGATPPALKPTAARSRRRNAPPTSTFGGPAAKEATMPATERDRAYWTTRVHFDGATPTRLELLRCLEKSPGYTEQLALRHLDTAATFADGVMPATPEREHTARRRADDAAYWAGWVYFDGAPLRRVDTLRRLERRADLSEAHAYRLLDEAAPAPAALA